MKTQRNILIAFILNFFFSIFEFVGGIVIGSVAIMSDAIHDLGDAASIGVSFFLEKKSKRPPDKKYTYGYTRFSVLGSIITSLILLLGSIFVIYNAILRIINPIEINYNGMIVFAIIGTIINLIAAFVTKEGDSLNQKAVNLHMLEDVLGWIIVLIGAIVMRFTDFALLDSLMSIAVALFILFNVLKSFKVVLNIFLEKVPEGICLEEIKEHLVQINGVIGVHHLHIKSIDGYNNYATLHAVISGDLHEIKHKIKDELKEFKIVHTTIEIEFEGEHCSEINCEQNLSDCHNHHHHHHHH